MDIPMSGMGSQRDTGGDEEIHVSALRKIIRTEEMNGMDLDKAKQSEETDDKDIRTGIQVYLEVGIHVRGVRLRVMLSDLHQPPELVCKQ